MEKEKEIIEKVKQHLQLIDLSFVNNEEDERWISFDHRNKEELRNGEIKEVYTVSFKTQDIEIENGGFIEGQWMVCYIDVVTEEILYYSGHWGRY